MKVIAATKPKVPVTAYFALAENMPDSQAQRPAIFIKPATAPMCMSIIPMPKAAWCSAMC